MRRRAPALAGAILSLIALGGAGCYDPSLGEGQYRCTAADPRCPESFACDPCSHLCLHPEHLCTAAHADAAAPDLSGDSAGCSGPDLPDDAATDSNCDGIDGDRADAVFVDPAGGDDGSGSGDLDHPLRTLGAALARAGALGHHQILVAVGVLHESAPLLLPPAVAGAAYGVYGGYAAGFQSRGAAAPSLEGAASAVVAAGLAADVTWDRVDVTAAAAGQPGGSSYGFLVTASAAHLTVRRCRVNAGDGAAGSPGAAADASDPGVPGSLPAGSCSCDVNNACGLDCGGCSPSPPQTLPACHGGSAYQGGAGGPCGGGPGSAGDGPAGGCPGGDPGCMGGVPDGAPGGSGGNGAPGPAGPSAGSFGSTGYGAAAGGDGGDGTGGSGGGGGSGPVLLMCNPMACAAVAASAPGPGGGSGGCGGMHGAGGGGGGGSFAVFLDGSDPALTDVVLQSGRGGAGGPGGAGSPGGGGGPSSSYSGVVSGPGGRGGDGGGGGGGGGGPSVCLVSMGGSQPRLTRTTFTVGHAGSGGAPGDGGGGAVGGERGADGVAAEML